MVYFGPVCNCIALDIIVSFASVSAFSAFLHSRLRNAFLADSDLKIFFLVLFREIQIIKGHVLMAGKSGGSPVWP